MKQNDSKDVAGTSGAVLSAKGKNKDEMASLEVAEDSREAQWTKPSFMGSLFMGKLRTQDFMPFFDQTEEDKKIGDEYCAKLEKFLLENLDSDLVDETGIIPDKVMKGLADLGAFGMKLPKEYGGLELSQANYLRAIALVGSHCASTVALLSAHQSIGVPQPLKLFGTPEQKKKFLPRFSAGAVSAFALTEPEVGSDPARMSTTAKLSEDGNHYILNGTKLWCTNGAIAEVMVVMAKSPPKMVNGREKTQITAFIVEKNMPGFEVLHRCRFMGLAGIQNALLKFTNVKVPKENIIWGEGKGLRLALITLNAGRLSLPAACVGGVRQALKIQRAWGTERSQWGAPVGKHEAGANRLAQTASKLFAMDAMTFICGGWVDRGTHDIRLEAAIAKIYCSETAQNLLDETLQMRGGRGYERATSLRARGEKPFPVERMVRDGRINLIVEGTSDILSLFVAREALDGHLKVAGAVLNSRLGIGTRLAAAVKAGLFYAAWYPWQWLAPIVDFSFWPRFAGNGKLGKHLRYCKRTAHKLARTLFHLMALNGPKLEKRQLQLIRITKIGSEIFAMTASIGKAKKLGTKEAAELSDLFCRQAKARIAENFKAIRSNDDASIRKVAAGALSGTYEFLEKGSVRIG
ncbi:MAG: acyl-CoA dehydrogenase family protein [Bdellovibrionales bacterium]|nr:acyl-CoA dehydrogenase family protein [Bdellovibrionales bacterium]